MVIGKLKAKINGLPAGSIAMAHWKQNIFTYEKENTCIGSIYESRKIF